MACKSAFSNGRPDDRRRVFHPRHWGRIALIGAAAFVAVSTGWNEPAAADAAPKRWKEDELVTSYKELASGGGLEAAVRTPALPKDPPQPIFLEALAWYAAGTPKSSGVLTLDRLDGKIAGEVGAYMRLLKAKVENGDQNDYARTRTWKLIQKYTLLRDAMTRPENARGYKYDAMGAASALAGADAWDREHTLRSAAEVADKVCRASYDRPVVIKYGNTNCTQCMLFEIIGSVQQFAENPAQSGKVDVYKVWWGYRPDESFAGRIRDPQRLDELAKAEGVGSSPYFIAYRNGRRYPCGDAFPDESGNEEHLAACLSRATGDAPAASFCETSSAGVQKTGGR